MGSSLFAHPVSQLWHTHKPPLQHSAALFVRVQPVCQEGKVLLESQSAKKPERLHCSIGV